jgi:hypothetical protein
MDANEFRYFGRARTPLRANWVSGIWVWRHTQKSGAHGLIALANANSFASIRGKKPGSDVLADSLETVT